jgi:hypothetical protein
MIETLQNLQNRGFDWSPSRDRTDSRGEWNCKTRDRLSHVLVLTWLSPIFEFLFFEFSTVSSFQTIIWRLIEIRDNSHKDNDNNNSTMPTLFALLRLGLALVLSIFAPQYWAVVGADPTWQEVDGRSSSGKYLGQNNQLNRMHGRRWDSVVTGGNSSVKWNSQDSLWNDGHLMCCRNLESAEFVKESLPADQQSRVDIQFMDFWCPSS